MTVGTAFFGLELCCCCEDLWGLLVVSGSSLLRRLRSLMGGGGACCFSPRLRCCCCCWWWWWCSGRLSRSGSSNLLTSPALEGLACNLLLLVWSDCCCCWCLLGLDSLGGDLDNSASDRDEFRSPEVAEVATEAAATTVTEFPFIGLLTVAKDGGERDCCCCSKDDNTLVAVVVDKSLLSPPFSLSLQSDG